MLLLLFLPGLEGCSFVFWFRCLNFVIIIVVIVVIVVIDVVVIVVIVVVVVSFQLEVSFE